MKYLGYRHVTRHWSLRHACEVNLWLCNFRKRVSGRHLLLIIRETVAMQIVRLRHYESTVYKDVKPPVSRAEFGDVPLFPRKTQAEVHLGSWCSYDVRLSVGHAMMM
jgi:hypothetical protein